MCTNTEYLNFHVTLILYMPTYTKLKLLEDLTYDTFLLKKFSRYTIAKSCLVNKS